MKFFFLTLLSSILWSAEPMHVYTLDGEWKAQLGDDRRWAAADFDDSAWVQRVPFLPEPGFAWYRRTVRIPAELTAPVSLWFPYLVRESEVYINGRLALQYGVPGNWTTIRWGPVPIIDLPEAGPGTTVSIAWRVRDPKNGVSEVLAPWPPPLFGSKSAIESAYNKKRFALFQVNIAWLILGLLNLLFAVAAFAFWRMQPDQPVYFWFAIAAAMEALWNIPYFANSCSDLPALLTLPGDTVVYGIELAAWVFLFQGDPLWPGWRRVCLPALAVVVSSIAGATAYAGTFHWGNFYLIGSVLLLGVIVLVVRGIRMSPPEQKVSLTILFIPWLVYEIGWFGWNFRSFSLAMGGTFAENTRRLLVFREPFEVDLAQAGAALSILAMGGILLARFNRVNRQQQLLTGELEAARQVQEMLVPAAALQVPGFELHSAYLPAQLVGGDFFQILPSIYGGVLILVGDVSGKGLRAAMVVSLVVGALRNRRSDEPGAILAELNNALAGQMGGGFVTCCCARFDSTGTATIANAGHPSPYADGLELAVEAGLPLGIAAGVSYQETIAEGRRFTFVSDGVVEAENPQRELFGFDRTREISGKSAQEVADAAKAWGQTDDITVVTVRRKV